MATLPDSELFVIGGVDTHRETHTGAVLDHLGRVLGTACFPADANGYCRLVAWMRSFGTLRTIGVEGTGSWGAGLTRHLHSAGIDVREVTRPNRQDRRRYGKTDTTDAVAAAKAVLAGTAGALPRGGTGPVESLRLLRIARNGAVKQRTMVANQIKAVIATAPEPLRRTLEGLTVRQVVSTASGYRPGDPIECTQAAKIALRSLARRWRNLTEEIDDLDGHMSPVVAVAAPAALLDELGVGTHTAADLIIAAGTNPHRLTDEASYAALCGVSPIDASSGRQQRHRLNRGGDRQANAALYRIIIVRLRYHEPTRQYMDRRLAEGKTKKEVIRCLKRHLARNVYQHLTNAKNTI